MDRKEMDRTKMEHFSLIQSFLRHGTHYLWQRFQLFVIQVEGSLGLCLAHAILKAAPATDSPCRGQSKPWDACQQTYLILRWMLVR